MPAMYKKWEHQEFIEEAGKELIRMMARLWASVGVMKTNNMRVHDIKVEVTVGCVDVFMSSIIDH